MVLAFLKRFTGRRYAPPRNHVACDPREAATLAAAPAKVINLPARYEDRRTAAALRLLNLPSVPCRAFSCVGWNARSVCKGGVAIFPTGV
jgi:hypothetical protein